MPLAADDFCGGLFAMHRMLTATPCFGKFIGRVVPPLGFAFALLFCLARASWAQEYRADPIDEEARRGGARAQQWVKDPAAYAQDKARFDAYFQSYYFPVMTHSSPENLAVLGKLRYDLVNKFLRGTTNQELQTNLTNMAYDAMLKVAANLETLSPPKVADPPYHPAVRYNAILVIGMLDETYASGAQPPKPYPKATSAMTSIVKSGMTNDRFPPPVVLGALIGLERHAAYRDTMAPATADAMTKALLDFVNNDKPIQGMDRKAFAWLRLRAASALARTGQVGPNNAIHDAIIKLVGELKTLDDRVEAAALLAKLKYDGAKIDADASSEALFQLARDVAAEESKRAEEYQLVRSGGGGGTFPMPGADLGDEEYDPYPRNHVLARLMQITAGLEAIKKAVPDEGKKKIDAVIAAIKPVIDKAKDDRTISGRVAEAIGPMEIAINQAAPPPAAAATADEELDI
jgi:hypothetical protein